jgi:REP element-mobilizing transposase RayT
MHVTLRRAKGLPSLRSERFRRLVEKAIDDLRERHGDSFRVVEYSIQNDHVHAIVEAEGAAELSRGMRSFAIRIALRVNRVLGRKRGRVWADRYHRRDLTSPRQVRSVLVYVLGNHAKHREPDVGVLDLCSSARWFSGWLHGPAPPLDPSPTQPARTWLLHEGWWRKGGGLLHLGEVPRPSARPNC